MSKLLKEYVNEGGGYFSSPLLVRSVDKGVASNGSNYLTVRLSDISMQIVAKKWTVSEEDLQILQPNTIVKIVGNIFEYRNSPQLKIEKVEHIDKSEYDLSDFYYTCPMKEDELKKEVESIIETIEDEEIATLVKRVIEATEGKYFTYPAAVSIHHSYKGGIAYHSLCMAKLADKVAELYPQVNRDYLIAGCLIHDVGKTVEMNGVVATNYSDIGNLEGHISIGAHIVSKVGDEIHIDERKLAYLVHIVLSHHGEYEYGSPVLPKTTEALLVHSIDEMDSRLNILEQLLNNVEKDSLSLKSPLFNNRAFFRTK